MYDITRPPNITPYIENEFKEYAVSQFPKEACAFVIEGKLVPVKNIHEDPYNHFAISLRDSLLVSKADGFLHSHPGFSLVPSESDLRSQIAANIPYGLCTTSVDGASAVVWWGDHLLDLPLLERPYIEAILDCSQLARSVYWQKLGVKIPLTPRPQDWKTREEDIFEENFKSLGFVEVTDDLQPYDIFLMSLYGSKTTGVAVYLGNHRLIHHLHGRLSCEDMTGRWAKLVKKAIRYNA